MTLGLKQESSWLEEVEIAGIIRVAVIDQKNFTVTLRLLEKSDGPAMPPILFPVRPGGSRSTLGQEQPDPVEAATMWSAGTAPELCESVIT